MEFVTQPVEVNVELNVNMVEDDGLADMVRELTKALVIIPGTVQPVKVTGLATDTYYIQLYFDMSNGDLVEYFFRCNAAYDEAHYVEINDERFDITEGDADPVYETRQAYLKHKKLLPEA